MPDLDRKLNSNKNAAINCIDHLNSIDFNMPEKKVLPTNFHLKICW